MPYILLQFQGTSLNVRGKVYIQIAGARLTVEDGGSDLGGHIWR